MKVYWHYFSKFLFLETMLQSLSNIFIRTYKILLLSEDKKRTTLKFYPTTLFISSIGHIDYKYLNNISFGKSTLSFFYFYNEETSEPQESIGEYNSVQVEFLDTTIDTLIFIEDLLEPIFESRATVYTYNYEKSEFQLKKPVKVKLYKVSDFRNTCSYTGKALNNIPNIDNRVYIRTDCIGECSAETQFFIEKESRAFIFISEKGGVFSSKKIIFDDPIIYLSFITQYINSLGDGYLSSMDIEESDSRPEEEEQVSNLPNIDSFITDLTVSNLPNRYLSMDEKNLFISDGKSVGVISKSFTENTYSSKDGK